MSSTKKLKRTSYAVDWAHGMYPKRRNFSF